MKHIHYYIYTATLAVLVACSADDGTYTVGEDDNAIKLYAGVVSSAQTSDMSSRASGEDIAMLENNKMAIQISGTWTGHGTDNIVTQTTTGETKTFVENQQIKRKVECSPIRYWDDYGTADPNNTTGRSEGLTIYAAAINKASVDAPTVTDYKSLSWTLDTDQKNTYWDYKDLLISNNVSGTNDARYNFSEKDNGKLLKFTHAMSKVTINLTAGDGFTDGKFVNEPQVTLLGFYYTGSVNIETGVVSTTTSSTSDINTHLNTPTSWTTSCAGSVTRDAIVYPHLDFASRTDNTKDIAKIEVDGNTYYINAEKIKAAITGEDKTMKPGLNYILNVKVNKTGVKIAAYVMDWVDVISETVEPKINISTEWGTTTGEAKTEGFSLYFRDASSVYGIGSSPYAANSTVSKSGDEWGMTPQLYWENHSVGYYFRAVWPATSTTSNPQLTKNVDNQQVINLTNVPYEKNTYPSDLMIGVPSNEPEGGITATEGIVNLTFHYVMSQVEVNLSTTDDYSKVPLDGAKVEIVNAYTVGQVILENSTVIPTGSTTTDELDYVSGSKYLSAVVPQSLTYTTPGATTNLRFKITIKNSDGTIDIYYADVAPICKPESTDKVATNGKWESGVHYIYNLKVSKTAIKVSATITDWTTVSGSDDVWF